MSWQQIWLQAWTNPQDDETRQFHLRDQCDSLAAVNVRITGVSLENLDTINTIFQNFVTRKV